MRPVETARAVTITSPPKSASLLVFAPTRAPQNLPAVTRVQHVSADILASLTSEGITTRIPVPADYVRQPLLRRSILRLVLSDVSPAPAVALNDQLLAPPPPSRIYRQAQAPHPPLEHFK